ncbi:MAG: hypothetical protein VX519_03385 [Myxococcota bacterium]|nr:hypothetical protein [Myxococcota bacterium]
MKQDIPKLVLAKQAQAPLQPQARKRYIAELRARYLEGTLDEVLFPEGFDVPESLMRALFPELFNRPEIEV